MILESARAAANHLFRPEFRAVLWKSLGLTLLLLVVIWFGLREVFELLAWPFFDQMIPDLPAWTGWIGFIAGVLASLGLALGLALLIAPVTAVVAGLFLDDVADLVEQEDYPHDPKGKALPAVRSLILSVKFMGVVIAGNIVALLMLLIPGVNIVAFFVVNGYLLGREFFEFAAMRFRPESEAKALRSRHALTVFIAGLVIAAFMAVPILNLLTPLFAAAMMVHLHKAVARAEDRLEQSPRSVP
ncbi:sulfate transporter family protein [Phyllobacterium lublinensis]|uniref:sulfate transporter family protein n=1 Tax=Phyllobacterium lublinensis TaxID=2875708 RepID=UPI001CCB3C00|nr:sulfate transporter family protein [Phyllobacterium sp. 2063]MBZ9656132.1 sulfate transporter family protein [Phyllobacterium sp. 2063]